MDSFRDEILTLIPKNGVGAEVGVWQGDFSARILQIAQPSRLHLIDPFESRNEPQYADAWYGTPRGADMALIRSRVEQRFANEITARRVVLHVARSEEVLPLFAEAQLDFVYIDGDHTYEAVTRDLALSFDACQRGGLIMLDDYLLGRWWGDGVVRAVHEFLGSHSDACTIVTCEAGQLVLEKR